MTKRALYIAALVGAVAFPALALAQGAILQGGPHTPGHAPMYVGPGQQGLQTVVQDSGPAGGGGIELGLSETLQVNRSAAGTGTGPLGTHNCQYDAAVTSGSYHYLCFDANAQGGGLVAYSNGGTASALPFSVYVNGSTVTLPTVPGNIWATVTAPITAGNVVCFNGNAGVLKDCGAVPGTGTVTQVATGAGLTGGPITGSGTLSCLTATASVLGCVKPDGTTISIAGGVLSAGGVASTKTTPYTLSSSDCSTVIPLGGSSYFTQVVGAAAGFLANCKLVFINTDTTRAKGIAINGYSAFKLWPLQTVTVTKVASSWLYDTPNRWKTPGGPLNLYSDFVLGNDANDCLAPGAGNACKTADQGLYLACDQFDLTGTAGGPTRVIVNLAAGVTDTTGIHFSCGAIPGTQGGAALQLNGLAGAAIAAVGSDAIGVFINATLQVTGDLMLSSTTSHAVTAQLGARIYLLGNQIKFNTTAGAHMFAANAGSQILIQTDYSIWGGAAEHFLATDGGAISPLQAYTATWGAAGNFTWFAFVDQGRLTGTGGTFNCNTFSCTGTRFSVSHFGIIATGGGGVNFFPGSAPGAADGATGGFYNFLLRRDLTHDNDNTPMWLDQAA